MVQGLVMVLAVLVAISLFPVALLAALFGIVDYLADDEQIEQVRGGRHGSGSPDLSERAGGRPDRVEDSHTEYGVDPADVGRAESEDDVGTVTCPACGSENSPGYDFCRDCVGEL
jgi:hypothetical protein